MRRAAIAVLCFAVRLQYQSVPRAAAIPHDTLLLYLAESIIIIEYEFVV